MVLLLHSPLSPPSGPSLFGPQTTLYPHTHYSYRVRTQNRSIRVSVAGTPATNRKEEHVVIVGAGIAGLATAVSLHRLGSDHKSIKSCFFIKRCPVSLRSSTNLGTINPIIV
ncbi:hypothetical protein RHGRI_011737 [Rhododendron griersonianum]|uniref:Uncharacterized protein n=1 Tax=Rhododendron griersonianum TaxID=479676 RepID=A0AAV6KNA6_9ERIC|nr:hypothetical protein RHGRI_011737 [Rhododendron griersonianum]KAG5553966.1 hypothetical protein RHGRI_011737 [Rhododendron griersonianum]